MHVLSMPSTHVVYASLQCCCHSPSKCSVLAGTWQGQSCSACVWAAEHSDPGSWGQKEKSCPGTCHLPVCALMTPSYKSVCHLIERSALQISSIFLNCKSASTCCDKMGKVILPSSIWGLVIFVLSESTNIFVCVTVPILLTVRDYLKLKLLGLTLWNPSCWSYIGNKALSEVWPVIIIKCS